MDKISKDVELRCGNPNCIATASKKKGQDFMALKIKEIAKEHDVPIVENPPLARALFARCCTYCDSHF